MGVWSDREVFISFRTCVQRLNNKLYDDTEEFILGHNLNIFGYALGYRII